MKNKKLSKQDIPKNYNFAAVDKIGTAYAYTNKPSLKETQWKAGKDKFVVIGFNYDTSDWDKEIIQR
ncbi:MAG: hypothetical protein RLZZ479_248 [Bacteroidota bacterium]|jgi:hypothetical protein